MDASVALEPGSGPHTPLTAIPAGLSYASALRPSLFMIITQTAVTAMLIPLLTILLLGCRRELRGKVIYYLNILVVLMGLATGAMSVTVQTQLVLNPMLPSTGPLLLADAILAILLPVLVDTILLTRLFAVYHHDWTSRLVRAIVLLPPILLTVARIVNIVITMRHIGPWFLNLGSVATATEKIWHLPGTRVEYFLQVIHNAFTSLAFLYKIRIARRRAHERHQSTYASKLSTLFWTATSNFVFPIILSLAQLIFIYVCPNFLAGIYMSTLFVTNDILQIICGLLATVWSSSPCQSGSTQSEQASSGKTSENRDMVYRTVSRVTQDTRTAVNSVQDAASAPLSSGINPAQAV